MGLEKEHSKIYRDKLVYIESYFVSSTLLGNRDTMMIYTDIISKLREFMVGRQSGSVLGREWQQGKGQRGLSGYHDDLDDNLKTMEGH